MSDLTCEPLEIEKFYKGEKPKYCQETITGCWRFDAYQKEESLKICLLYGAGIYVGEKSFARSLMKDFFKYKVSDEKIMKNFSKLFRITVIVHYIQEYKKKDCHYYICNYSEEFGGKSTDLPDLRYNKTTVLPDLRYNKTTDLPDLRYKTIHITYNLFEGEYTYGEP